MLKQTKLMKAIKRYGLISTIKYVFWVSPFKIVDYIEGFDRTYGTETSDMVDKFDLGYPSSTSGKIHTYAYQPSLYREFETLIKSCKIQFEDFTFIDVGSGKGRVQLYASNWPFKKIIGIEFSRPLCEIALKNLKLYSSNQQKCFDITVLNENATTYQFPKGNLILYMYNPFSAEIMQDFLTNLRRQLDPAMERTIYILYLNPLHTTVLSSFGFKQVLKSSLLLSRRLEKMLATLSISTQWKIYRNC